MLKLIKKGLAKQELPTGPEELRARITLLGVAWSMVGFVHTNRPWLADLDPQIWQRYLNYLLGEFVWGLVAKDHAGVPVSTPAWKQLLAYEHAIRMEAMRCVRDPFNMTLGKAMEKAMENPVIKERNFTTPLALSASSSRSAALTPTLTGSPGGAAASPGVRKKTKGEKRREAKEKYQAETKCAAQTPDGRKICFKYNDPKAKCKKGETCIFAHVCGKCFQKHPMYRCGE